MPDKRKFIRHDAIHLLDYVVIDPKGNSGLYSMGRTLDVSFNGLRLETIHPFSPGTRLSITVGLGNELVDLTGTVIHCRAARGRHFSGIEFDDMKDDSRRVFGLYIDAFKKTRETAWQ